MSIISLGYKQSYIMIYLTYCRGENVAQLVEYRTGMPLTQGQFSSVAREFSPRVHVRIQWIMETLKHPACTRGWVP